MKIHLLGNCTPLLSRLLSDSFYFSHDSMNSLHLILYVRYAWSTLTYALITSTWVDSKEQHNINNKSNNKSNFQLWISTNILIQGHGSWGAVQIPCQATIQSSTNLQNFWIFNSNFVDVACFTKNWKCLLFSETSTNYLPKTRISFF